MISVALRGLWGRKTRAVLTAISIVLGTAMITGTFVVRDQITGAFGEIIGNELSKTDVLLQKKTAFTSDQGAQAGPLPASLIPEVAKVPGVAKAEGQVQALGALVIGGKYAGSTTGAPSFVLSVLSDTFNPYTYSEGHGPQASGQVVVNSKLAEDKHLHVGQHVELATDVGLRPVTIVGVFTVGTASTIGGATIVGTTFNDAQQWFDRVDQTSTISVKADSGVSQTELKQRLIAALPHDVKVQTGPEAAAEQSQQISSGITGFLTPLLLAFAGATVFAGAFIIFNTFAITVAQRTREFAMLRTIGASRRQVLRSVLLEALLIGLLASLAGIVVGVGFAKLLDTAFDAIGFGLPTAPIHLGATTILLPLFVGTSVAILAAIGPAFRATRVPPIAALREGAELPPSALARHATLVSSVLLLLGLGGILDGVFEKGGFFQTVTGLGSTASVLISLAGGAILCFLAVAILSAHIVQPLSRAIGAPLAWLIWVGDWANASTYSVRRVGHGYARAWYLTRRILSFVLALLAFLIPVAIAAGIAALVSGPLALVVGVAGAGIALFAVVRTWLGSPTEWPPEQTPALTGRAWRGRRWVAAVLVFVAVVVIAIVGGELVGILAAIVTLPLGSHASNRVGEVARLTVWAVGLVAAFALAVLAIRTRPWPPVSPSQLTSRLARENTTRNPGRTAVTSSSLMIGVALVVFVAVFVNGFKDSFLGALDNSITSDLIIQSESFAPIPKEAVPTLQAVPQVETATGIQFTDARINHGGTDVVNGIDPGDFDKLYAFTWQKGGSNAVLSNFQGDEALVEEQFAKSHHLDLGDHFTITSIEDNKLRLRVVGQYKDPVLMTGISIPSDTFDTWTTNSNPGVILAKFNPGVSLAAGKAAAAKALRQFPVAKVRTNAEYKQSTEDQVNGFLYFLYLLLAMIGIISLVGIINTLALSVFERTREIGMLRAVGTTRRQLRRMVRYESVITSVIGGLLGVGVGLVFGWILTKGLSDQGIEFSVPVTFIVVVMVVAALAGVVAAITPARRAARLDVLEALQYE
jgi:ABC-type antimicrobial peptide transport system permease subunit